MYKFFITSLVAFATLTLLSSCGKDDEPDIPAQGYLVVNGDTMRFNGFNASEVATSSGADTVNLTVTGRVHPGGDNAQPALTTLTLNIKAVNPAGYYADKRCAGCPNTPTITLNDNSLGDYSSGICYINPNTANAISTDIFRNEKKPAITVVFSGILCQPTSDTTFKSIKVSGVIQDAPF